MSDFADMQEILAALRSGAVPTERQLIAACEMVLARPAGSTRFAADLIWVLGQRLSEQAADPLQQEVSTR